MPFISEIEGDLDWRVEEIDQFRHLLLRPSNSTVTERVLIRAGWALLYAHYEGFCKFALTAYFDEIRRMGIASCNLPRAMHRRSLERSLKEVKNASSKFILERLEKIIFDEYRSAAEFPEVDTQSNLWPQVLAEILDDADIWLPSLDNHRFKIQTLVARRNKIAHGERDLIFDLRYYLDFESVVSELMYELALEAEVRLEELAATHGCGRP